LALVFAYILAGEVRAQVNRIEGMVSGHSLLLEAICINTANTDSERNTCQRAMRGERP
jgi:hypothetical protein